MIKISEFINGYKLAKDKEKYIEPHITVKYVPFATKLAHVRRIIDFSMYKEVNGRKVFWTNTLLQYELTMQTIIQLYTDIDLTDGSKDEGKWLDGFDKLEEAQAMNDIAKAIGADYQGFSTMLKMGVEDEVFNNSLVNWLDTKAEAMGLTLDTIEGGIKELASKEQLVSD